MAERAATHRHITYILAPASKDQRMTVNQLMLVASELRFYTQSKDLLREDKDAKSRMQNSPPKLNQLGCQTMLAGG